MLKRFSREDKGLIYLSKQYIHQTNAVGSLDGGKCSMIENYNKKRRERKEFLSILWLICQINKEHFQRLLIIVIYERGKDLFVITN